MIMYREELDEMLLRCTGTISTISKAMYNFKKNQQLVIDMNFIEKALLNRHASYVKSYPWNSTSKDQL